MLRTIAGLSCTTTQRYVALTREGGEAAETATISRLLTERRASLDGLGGCEPGEFEWAIQRRMRTIRRRRDGRPSKRSGRAPHGSGQSNECRADEHHRGFIANPRRRNSGALNGDRRARRDVVRRGRGGRHRRRGQQPHQSSKSNQPQLPAHDPCAPNPENSSIQYTVRIPWRARRRLMFDSGGTKVSSIAVPRCRLTVTG